MTQYNYFVLIEKDFDLHQISELISSVLGSKFEMENDDNYYIYYHNGSNDLKELLEAFNNEGIETIKAYISCQSNTKKDFDLQLLIAKEHLKLLPKDIYDNKGLLTAITNKVCNKTISEFVLKNYYGDEEMKKVILGVMNANLNVSKAATTLYMHRNTLIYKLDKFKEVTGYDIRVFKDAYFVKSIL